MDRPRIVIAGASGFVGLALAEALAPRASVIGLSRRPPQGPPQAPFAEWRACDLFSLKDAQEALRGADVVVYLVHSMRPSARLTQGSFCDMDLICADNLARAARREGLSRIVYLGGLLPEQRPLSPHLRSRQEVEEALASTGVPLTTLRAGLIIGPGGSSFLMLQRLVERLPIMLCPAWTETLTQPVDLRDVVALLSACAAGEVPAGTYDIGGPDVMTYREMMLRLAAVLHRRLRTVKVPLFTPGLSRLWVSMITGAPGELVGPLVESLRHPMVARDRRLQERLGRPGVPFEEACAHAMAASAASRPVAYSPAPPSTERSVRSVQRLPLPPRRDAAWVAREYMTWLPRHLRGVLHVEVEEDSKARFFLASVAAPLLELSLSAERSAPDRQLFYITGGILSHKSGRRPRLEFRQVHGQPVVLAAIHDYVPRLPWLLYSLTQAVAHLVMMALFGRHLRRCARQPG